MERRHFLKTTALGASALGLGLAPFNAWAAEEAIQLTILHTNDTHSRINPFPSKSKKHANMGGMARRAAMVQKVRQEGNHVLLLDAGDIFQGTPYFNFFGGELEFKLMSKMGYDATTLGNHDFDAGLEGLIKQLPHANFELLNANYVFKEETLKKRVKPYKIFKKGPIKIGVFGVGIALEGLVPEQLYGQTKCEDAVAKAKEMVQELKDKNCHLIVCLSHLGNSYDNDKVSDAVLAKEVDGIDLIIGGHTHTFLEKPQELVSSQGSKVLVNQVGWAGINLGRIDFFFSKKLDIENTKASVLGLHPRTGKC